MRNVIEDASIFQQAGCYDAYFRGRKTIETCTGSETATYANLGFLGTPFLGLTIQSSVRSKPRVTIPSLPTPIQDEIAYPIISRISSGVALIGKLCERAVFPEACTRILHDPVPSQKRTTHSRYDSKSIKQTQQESYSAAIHFSRALRPPLNRLIAFRQPIKRRPAVLHSWPRNQQHTAVA